ncbi:MAG: UDP-glucose dehydrogenase family protein [Holophagaceae bacterium]
MKIAVVGTGYVGLVTAVCFAHVGLEVAAVDKDASKIETLRLGKSPIYEPGLEDLLVSSLQGGRLSFHTQIGEALEGTCVVFICVGTPQAQDGQANMKYVFQVASEISEYLAQNPRTINSLIVATKSTVPVGTASKIHKIIEEHLISKDVSSSFEVVSNPEFLKEGDAISDFMNPDRVVVGCLSEETQNIMHTLYAPFLKNNDGAWFSMKPESSELTKYASNAMLATRISFMNEIANLSEKVGADIDDVKRAVGADKRIGKSFLNPGPGFGGSCFPKDVSALLTLGDQVGEDLKVLRATLQANQYQKKILLKKIAKLFSIDPLDASKPLLGRRITLWGLAFKANTDDVRESIALDLVGDLIRLGAKVAVHDYIAMENFKRALPGDNLSIIYEADPIQATKDSDLLVIVTEWANYQKINLEKVARLMKYKQIIDARNLFSPYELAKAGWMYESIGRPKTEMNL